MIKEFEITSKTLQLRCFLVVTKNREKLFKYLNKMDKKAVKLYNKEPYDLNELNEDLDFYFESEAISHGNLIFLSKPDKGLLVHELVHFLFNSFELKGIPINEENQEIFAYTIEYFYDEGAKWLDKIKGDFNEKM